MPALPATPPSPPSFPSTPVFALAAFVVVVILVYAIYLTGLHLHDKYTEKRAAVQDVEAAPASTAVSVSSEAEIKQIKALHSKTTVPVITASPVHHPVVALRSVPARLRTASVSSMSGRYNLRKTRALPGPSPLREVTAAGNEDDELHEAVSVVQDIQEPTVNEYIKAHLALSFVKDVEPPAVSITEHEAVNIIEHEAGSTIEDAKSPVVSGSISLSPSSSVDSLSVYSASDDDDSDMEAIRLTPSRMARPLVKSWVQVRSSSQRSLPTLKSTLSSVSNSPESVVKQPEGASRVPCAPSPRNSTTIKSSPVSQKPFESRMKPPTPRFKRSPSSSIAVKPSPSVESPSALCLKSMTPRLKRSPSSSITLKNPPDVQTPSATRFKSPSPHLKRQPAVRGKENGRFDASRSRRLQDLSSQS
ncbi:hypothetical protein B0H10DRAFT_2039222 [Mycena sp. CBHHK59/15]|nr:hypothetical protein B0H10DRAFT_2039222 [Mycena sp. CBHHK59/15]